MLAELLRAATERPLTAREAELAFTEVIEGRATPVQMAALLVALRTRGPAPEEVAGGVRALRRAMVPLPLPDGRPVVDTCGTGGGACATFNISTAAAFVAAAGGAWVAKHGNRSFTSRCGSADVLEALGVRLDLTPEEEAQVLERARVVFMFAPLHHPAMRHVAPVRRELAMPTVMNLLGPLTNPARVRRQVVGVADARLLDLVAHALVELGHEHALVVHGEIGMDEMSPVGPTAVREVRNGAVRAWTFDPRALGWPEEPLDELAGGGPEENAARVAAVLQGRDGGIAVRAVAANAGAALYVAGCTPDLETGIRAAEDLLRRGAGWATFEAMRDAIAALRR